MDDLARFVKQINEAIRSDKIRRTALTTTLAKHKPRIFEQGLAADGSKIGTYSVAYGKKKSARGRNPGFVNLRDTDQMYADYGLIVEGGNYGFGFQNNFNADKMGWMTDLYDKEIAALNDEEMKVLTDVLFDELNR